MKIVKVTCKSTDQNGLPVARARITATLMRTEIDGEFVAPRLTSAVADEQGVAVLSLWPNALGVEGSTYKVVAINPATGREFINALISVPNSDSNLHEILVQAPLPPVSASERALVAAQGALALVTAQAGIATTAAQQAEYWFEKSELAATGGENAVAIAALQTQIGTTRSTDPESITYRINTVETMADPLAYYILSKG